MCLDVHYNTAGFFHTQSDDVFFPSYHGYIELVSRPLERKHKYLGALLDQNKKVFFKRPAEIVLTKIH